MFSTPGLRPNVTLVLNRTVVEQFAMLLLVGLLLNLFTTKAAKVSARFNFAAIHQHRLRIVAGSVSSYLNRDYDCALATVQFSQDGERNRLTDVFEAMIDTYGSIK